MTFKAIPTTYNGVNFRSRLEARWAAFFDEMKWRWAYEPVDLAGWIPDFIVGDDFETGAYVEVKPIGGPDAWHTYADELQRASQTVPATSRGFLVLGLQPRLSADWWPILGVVRQNRTGAVVDGILYKSIVDGIFDVPIGSWDDNYPGLMTGRKYLFPEYSDLTSGVEIENAWKRASNAVQWKAPRA